MAKGGGAVLLEGRHIDNEYMRSQGRIQKAGGCGGGGCAVRFRPDPKAGGGGGGVGAVRFRPGTKSGGGGGGGVQSASGPIRKVGGGGAAIGPRGRHFV